MSTEMTQNEKLKKTVDDLTKTIVDAKADIDEYNRSIKKIYEEIDAFINLKNQEIQELEGELPEMIENCNKMITTHTTLYKTLTNSSSVNEVNESTESTSLSTSLSNGVIKNSDDNDDDSSDDDDDDSDSDDFKRTDEQQQQQQHDQSVHDNVNNLLRNTDADGRDAMNEIAGDYEEILTLKESRRKILRQCEEENEKNIRESLIKQNLEAVLAVELSTMDITEEKNQILLDRFHNYMVMHKTVPIVDRITQSLINMDLSSDDRVNLTSVLTEGL